MAHSLHHFVVTHWVLIAAVTGILVTLDIVAFFTFDTEGLITWIIFRILLEILIAILSGGSSSSGFGGGDSGGGGASSDW